MSDERWNHNIHLHPVVLDAVPTGAQRALDVGCGEGMLSRDLHRTVQEVVGLDVHGPSLELARSQGDGDGDGITYVQGDLLDRPFEPASFDVVASVATLHHMDAVAGLDAMRDLVRPGGVLAVVGLAMPKLPRDLHWELAGAVTTRWLKLRRTYWEHSAPIVWPPPETYDRMRAIAEELLPGVRYRRHVLWRYSLVWRRPAAPEGGGPRRRA